ncbi:MULTISPECIES: hypothetical protein [Arthrobacter]|uniref:Subtilisin inhibitor-like n=2 Tax=Arthrobacter TaxID=1663 RepID=A0ABU9KI88_9MICC|nr:hypothetical protein [Arthrobacter sp. YJM1]MDP5226497.1 hypothetical protein [Arthrobacter sp. YJM1]
MGWKTVLRIVLPGFVAALLSGCGTVPGGTCAMSSDGSGTQSCGPWSTRLTTPPVIKTVSPTGAPGLISLKIRRVDQPGAQPVDLYLQCHDGSPDPASTVPNPAAACTLVNTKPSLLDPVPAKGEMCSQLYGGPETATVTGSVNGKPVSLTLSRTDGCKTAQWNELTPLLGGTAAGA